MPIKLHVKPINSDNPNVITFHFLGRSKLTVCNYQSIKASYRNRTVHCWNHMSTTNTTNTPGGKMIYFPHAPVRGTHNSSRVCHMVL